MLCVHSPFLWLSICCISLSERPPQHADMPQPVQHGQQHELTKEQQVMHAPHGFGRGPGR